MIIKGKSRAGPGSLALHLGNAETNEVISIVEARGVSREDLKGGLTEMYAMAKGTRIELPLYHASMSPELPNRLTEDQRAEAIDALEDKLGFSGNPRIVVLHEKEGREHFHIVWSRVDPETRHAISDSHNYRMHEEVSRDLERRFGHNRIQGALAEREGVERPDRTPSRAELRQEERSGIKGKDVKAEVSEIFRNSDGPDAFRTGLAELGYSLAKGDRRDYVIIDKAGGIHSLARRIDGMKAEQLRDFMEPLDKESVPSIEEARQLLRDKEADRKLYEKYGYSEREIALLEASYSRGDDYVSQTTAALQEYQMRQAKLNNTQVKVMPWEEEKNEDVKKDDEFEDKKRKEENEEVEKTDSTAENSSYLKSTPLDGIEMTDEQSTRMERLMNAIEVNMNSNSNKNGNSGGRGGRKR